MKESARSAERDPVTHNTLSAHGDPAGTSLTPADAEPAEPEATLTLEQVLPSRLTLEGDRLFVLRLRDPQGGLVKALVAGASVFEWERMRQSVLNQTGQRLAPLAAGATWLEVLARVLGPLPLEEAE